MSQNIIQAPDVGLGLELGKRLAFQPVMKFKKLRKRCRDDAPVHSIIVQTWAL